MYKIIGADGHEYGPVSADQLRQWLTEGRVNTDTQVLPEGGTGWLALRALPEFSGLLAGGSTPPPIRSRPGQLGGMPFPKNSPFAVTGLVLGIFSVTFGLCCCYGLPFNLLGIIFSLIGLAQIQKRPDAYSGRGLAIAGLVCSIVSLTLAVALMTIGFAMSWDQLPYLWKKL
jgi:Domain of unknown function (DUF4190)/GYF domain 2